MTDPLDLDAIEASYLGYDPDYAVFRLIAAARVDRQEIADTVACLKYERQRAGELLRERDAEIARLRDVERRHLGWCDACQVYHRTGNCPVTGEPPSKEAREGWSLPTPQAAAPGVDAIERAKGIWGKAAKIPWEGSTGHHAKCVEQVVAQEIQQYGDERAAAAREAEPGSEEKLTGSPASQEYIDSLPEDDRVHYEASAPPGADAMRIAARVWYTEIDGKPQSPGWTITTYARALQQYGDERAAAATEAERCRCATIDHIDIDLIRREARAAAIEEAATIADHFVCGSYGMDGKAIRAIAANPGIQT